MSGGYLGVNDYLVSDDNSFFAIMQSDARFVIYRGSGPSSQGQAIWSSGTARQQGQYFAVMQLDGNFCIYEGTDRMHQGAFVWNSGPAGPVGMYVAIMQNNGHFRIYSLLGNTGFWST